MRIRNLQALRALAALAILVLHITLWQGKIPPHRPYIHIFMPGHAGVDLFFVISGFIMVFIQPAPIRSLRAYCDFMGHRVARIYPPLWLILIPLTVLWLIHPAWFNRHFGYRVDLAASYLLLPQHWPPLLSVSWTLIHEVYFYWIVSIGLCFAARGRLIFGSAWFLLVLVGFIALGPVRQQPLLQLVFSPFSLTFLLGYFLGLGFDRLNRLPANAAATLLAVGFLSLLVGASSLPWPGTYPNNNLLIRLACFGFPSALIVAGAVGLERHWALTHRAVQKLGDASYSLYLVHVLLIMAIYHLAALEHVRDGWAQIAVALFTFVVSIAAGMAYHFLLERPSCRLARCLVDHLFGTPPGHRPEIPPA